MSCYALPVCDTATEISDFKSFFLRQNIPSENGKTNKQRTQLFIESNYLLPAVPLNDCKL